MCCVQGDALQAAPKLGSAPGMLKEDGRVRNRRRVSAVGEDAVEEDEQDGGFKVLARARTKKKADSDDDETAEAETSGTKCVFVSEPTANCLLLTSPHGQKK